MSRSRKKTPITPITKAESDSHHKRTAHQRERAVVKQVLHTTQDDSVLPSSKEFGDPWTGRKDGKQYVAGAAKGPMTREKRKTIGK